MKQVIFRGKTKDTNEWVYGSLLQSEVDVNGNSNCMIVTRFADCADLSRIDVETKTVGFYVGIDDVIRNKVFTGDIVTCLKDGFQIGNEDVIEFKNGCAWLRYRNTSLHDFISREDADFDIEANQSIHD